MCSCLTKINLSITFFKVQHVEVWNEKFLEFPGMFIHVFVISLFSLGRGGLIYIVQYTVKCFIFAGSNFRGFQNWTYSWDPKFAVRQFICIMRSFVI